MLLFNTALTTGTDFKVSPNPRIGSTGIHFLLINVYCCPRIQRIGMKLLVWAVFGYVFGFESR